MRVCLIRAHPDLALCQVWLWVFASDIKLLRNPDYGASEGQGGGAAPNALFVVLDTLLLGGDWLFGRFRCCQRGTARVVSVIKPDLSGLFNRYPRRS